MKAEINGIEMKFEIHGLKNGPWITLSHSLACNSHMWDGQIETLGKYFQLLTYDTRGHGESSSAQSPYSFEMLADDVFALLHHLGIDSTHFVGLSMGGMIGQSLSLKHPEVVNSLVLADTGHTASPQSVEQWEKRIQLALEQGMDALVEPTLERWFNEPFRQARSKEYMAISEQIRSTPVAGFVGCANALMNTNFTDRLKNIKSPTLAIAGEQDASAAATRYLGQHIPNAKTVIIPSAGHISNVEQPKAFNQAVLNFLC